jgi:hypothetical protein
VNQVDAQAKDLLRVRLTIKDTVHNKCTSHHHQEHTRIMGSVAADLNEAPFAVTVPSKMTDQEDPPGGVHSDDFIPSACFLVIHTNTWCDECGECPMIYIRYKAKHQSTSVKLAMSLISHLT